jgi:hypothetical protein
VATSSTRTHSDGSLRNATLGCVIVFDSNQLRNVLPGKPALPMLEAAARHSGHTLATTDIVLHEVTRQFCDELTKRIGEIRSGVDGLNSLLPKARRVPDPLATQGLEKGNAAGFQEVIDRYKATLTEHFHILGTDPDDALEGLLREADRRPPCKANGEGGRDTAILLTALRSAGKPDPAAPAGSARPLIFVSGDKAFTDPADRSVPAADLRKDIGDRSMVFCGDVVSLLGELGFPSTWVDPAEIIVREDFQQALRTAVFTTLRPLLNVDAAIELDHSADAMLLQATRTVKRARQCSGGAMTMTSIEGIWSCEIRTRIARIPGRGVFFGPSDHSGYTHQAIVVDLVALTVQDNAGEVIEAQFSPMTITPQF